MCVCLSFEGTKAAGHDLLDANLAIVPRKILGANSSSGSGIDFVLLITFIEQ